jgi:predicted methyltransferase
MSAREILDLARVAGVDARTRVLDLCCGSGGPALHLAWQTGCRIVGVDRSSEAIYLARISAEHQGLDRRVTFIVAEALCPPVDAASFDAILLYETMLAFEDRRRLVRVVRKLLRPGGRFGLTFEEGRPLSSAERRRVPEGEEVWLTPESEFRVLLEAAGFRIRWVEDRSPCRSGRASSGGVSTRSCDHCCGAGLTNVQRTRHGARAVGRVAKCTKGTEAGSRRSTSTLGAQKVPRPIVSPDVTWRYTSQPCAPYGRFSPLV